MHAITLRREPISPITISTFQDFMGIADKSYNQIQNLHLGDISGELSHCIGKRSILLHQTLL